MLAIYSALAFAAAVLAAPAADGPILGISVGAGATASATATAIQPNPTQVYINGITYGGTGCPQGSVGSFISADKQTFTLIFDEMVASSGPGTTITDQRKNCQLNIDLQYPSGFQYSVLNTDFRGYAYLPKATDTGVQQATYYFSGSSAQASTSTTFKGPTDGDYSVTDAIPFTSTIWSPCGAALPLNINTQVRLTGTDASQLTQDSADGKVTFVVGVQWQKCTQ